jgi:hypothetical protein
MRLLVIFLVASISFVSQIAFAGDWSTVYNGDTASFAIVGVATDPGYKVPVYIVIEKLNHLDTHFPPPDEKRKIRSTATQYLVSCDDRKFVNSQSRYYGGDNQTGDVVFNGFDRLVSKWDHAVSGSAQEYIIGKICDPAFSNLP